MDGSGESDIANNLIEITPNDHEESKLDKNIDSIQVDSPQVSISDPYPLDICIVSEVPISPLYTLIEVRVKKRVIGEKENRAQTREKVLKIINVIPK